MKKYLTDFTFMTGLTVLAFSSVLLVMKIQPKAPSQIQPSAPVPSQVRTNFKRSNSGIALKRISTKSPGVYVVAQDGSGDARSLEEILPQIQKNEKIFLKKGQYNWPQGFVELKGKIELSGEGIDSVLVLTRAVYISEYDLNIHDLNIKNLSDSVGLYLSDGKTLNIKNVTFIGNNENNGLVIEAGYINAENLRFERFRTAIQLNNPYKVEVKNVVVTRSDYGVRFKSDDDAKIEGLKTYDMRRYSIDFVEKFLGKLTCVRCEIEGDKSNDILRFEEEL